MKKIILIILMCMFFGSLVSGASFVFEKDEKTDLTIPVYHNNRSKADAGVDCFLTAKYPNGSVFINDNQMTFNVSGHYNYTFIATQMGVLGTYNMAMRCDNTADFGFTTFTILVNPSGNELSTAGAILYIIVFVISIGFFILSLYTTTRLKWKDVRNPEGWVIGVNELKWLKLVFMFITWLVLIWIFFLAQGISGNYLFFNGAYKFFRLIFMAMLGLTLPITAILFVVGFIAVVESRKLKELIKRNLYLGEKNW